MSGVVRTMMIIRNFELLLCVVHEPIKSFFDGRCFIQRFLAQFSIKPVVSKIRKNLI